MTKQQTNNNITNQIKRLSVQITLTGQSFLVTAPNGEVLFFSEISFDSQRTPEETLLELQEAFNTENLLQGPFEKVTLIYTTQNYTLVPSSLFNPDKVSEYLKFNTKILGNDYISHEEMDGLNIVVVYVPLMNINNYLFERFGTFEYFHSSTLLVQNLIHKNKHAEDPQVYLHLLKNQFECVVISKGNLLMCNSFPFKTPEDFIYYVLFAFEQLKLNPETIDTFLMGQITKESELYEFLYTYVRNVTFSDFNFSPIDTELPHERFLLKSVV